MKVISIIQPFATLIMLREKRFETRSWETKHRDELGIHASKKVDKKICEQEPFKSVLAKHGYTATNLPTGMILGTVNLIGCYSIGKVDEFQKEAELPWVDRFIWGNEFDFGWYKDGRFAWEVPVIEAYSKPIPAKGQLGIWNYNQ
jgi:hypothetical protein